MKQIVVRIWSQITLRRIALVVILCMVGYQLQTLLFSVPDAAGNYVVPSTRVVVDDFMILERHFDVAEATDWTLNDQQRRFKEYFQTPLEIQLVQGHMAGTMDWQELSPRMKLVFSYQSNSQGLKILTGCQMTPALAFMISYGSIPTAAELQSGNFDRDLLTVNADGAHQSIVEAATFLELPFMKDIDLAFNQEELESLVTHARAVIVAQVAMCAALSIDQDLWMLQTMRRNFFLAYQPYMTTFHRDYILWANIRNRLQGLAWLVLMVTILVLVVRRDAALIVREELRSRGVTMNWWLLTRVTLSNWRFLIWPAAEPKMRQHIANQCEAIRMRRVHQVLRQQASELWAKLQSGFEVSSIEPLYRIAINPQEPEGKRERSLMAMIETYHRWCKWQQTTPVPVSKTSDTPRQRSVTKVDRHDELRQAILSYTASLPVGSESWSMVKLQNLLMALATIKHQFGRPGVDVLCQHQNLEVLLDNRSMLMQVIRTDDRQIIGELLGLSSRHRQAEREVARPLPLVLSGKRLVIVTSDRITSTKPRLEEAAYELGAKSVEFINSDNCGQVKRATGPETLVVLIRSGIGHAVSDSLKSQGIKPIVVNRGSATRFKQQVCQALAS